MIYLQRLDFDELFTLADHRLFSVIVIVVVLRAQYSGHWLSSEWNTLYQYFSLSFFCLFFMFNRRVMFGSFFLFHIQIFVRAKRRWRLIFKAISVSAEKKWIEYIISIFVFHRLINICYSNERLARPFEPYGVACKQLMLWVWKFAWCVFGAKMRCKYCRDGLSHVYTTHGTSINTCIIHTHTKRTKNNNNSYLILTSYAMSSLVASELWMKELFVGLSPWRKKSRPVNFN